MYFSLKTQFTYRRVF